jgi:hypothetical protein
VLAYFTLDFAAERDTAAAVDQIQKLSLAGYQVSIEEVKERTGYKVEPKAESGKAESGNADGNGNGDGETLNVELPTSNVEQEQQLENILRETDTEVLRNRLSEFADRILNFDPDQPRDEKGQWAGEGTEVSDAFHRGPSVTKEGNKETVTFAGGEKWERSGKPTAASPQERQRATEGFDKLRGQAGRKSEKAIRLTQKAKTGDDHFAAWKGHQDAAEAHRRAFSAHTLAVSSADLNQANLHSAAQKYHLEQAGKHKQEWMKNREWINNRLSEFAEKILKP